MTEKPIPEYKEGYTPWFCHNLIKGKWTWVYINNKLLHAEMWYERL